MNEPPKLGALEGTFELGAEARGGVSCWLDNRLALTKTYDFDL